ncbi:hypothetical protein [Ekhidna sp. To15]|uniref:hypothetical protein n=1 Tax=Ekhidna sp. To15 TaxID=3395267 RepID=UPI003F521FC8
MKNQLVILTFLSLVMLSCSKVDTSISSDFSGIVYEYATERPLAGIEVIMSAKNSPTDLIFSGTTTTDNEGRFYFNPEQSDTILAYNYSAKAEGFEIEAPTEFLIAYQNNPPNYDTLIAYEDAYIKVIVNPAGGADNYGFNVSLFNDEIPFSFFNRLAFQDSDEVQVGIKKLFKTKTPIKVVWYKDNQDFEEEIELLAQDTVSITISY